MNGYAKRLIVVAVVAAALAALAIPTVDEPLARWLFARDTAPRVWDAGITALEYAAGLEPWRWAAVAVLVGGVAATAIVPRWRGALRAWLFVALVHLVCRNVVFWLKPALGRLRPYEWIERGGGTFWRDGVAFPSGHVLYFASLALPIAVIWPRARVAAAVAVGYAMVARVAVDAHFASDVLGGLAIACAVTAACATLLPRASPPRSPSPPASPR